MPDGGVCGLDQSPAQVAGSVLAQRAAPVMLAGLVGLRREAGVADELDRGGEAVDLAEFAGDRVGEDPADAGAGQEQRDVAMVGAGGAQLVRSP